MALGRGKEQTLSGDGTTPDVWRTNPEPIVGPYFTLSAAGTFAGGTVTWEWSDRDDQDWRPLKKDGAVVQMISPDMVNLVVCGGFIRASVSGATSPNIRLDVL